MTNTTVYPARAGAFPAASFRTVADALEYVRKLQPAPGWICTCPAKTFWVHYPDTLPRGKR